MAVFTSSIGSQIAGFEREVEAMVLRVLRAGGRRFRARMIREQLSGPPGVYRKTGKLQRSLSYGTIREGSNITLGASIGRGAPYAEEHEERGRIKFRQTFEQEARKIEEEVRLAFEVLARNPGRSGTVSAGAITEADAAALATLERFLGSRGLTHRGGRGRRNRGNQPRTTRRERQEALVPSGPALTPLSEVGRWWKYSFGRTA